MLGSSPSYVWRSTCPSANDVRMQNCVERIEAVQDVLADGLGGSGAVAQCESFQDSFVLLDRLPHSAGALPQHVTRKLFAHLFDQVEQKRIVGVLVQRLMKASVSPAEFLQVVAGQRGFHSLYRPSRA